jgi:hypothetical protein
MPGLVIHWRDVDDDQPGDALGRDGGQRHRRFAAHRMADDDRFLQLQFVEQRQQILRHGGVVHVVGARRKAVVAQIDFDHRVLFMQIARQHAQVVQIAEQPVNQQHRQRV